MLLQVNFPFIPVVKSELSPKSQLLQWLCPPFPTAAVTWSNFWLPSQDKNFPQRWLLPPLQPWTWEYYNGVILWDILAALGKAKGIHLM